MDQGEWIFYFILLLKYIFYIYKITLKFSYTIEGVNSIATSTRKDLSGLWLENCDYEGPRDRSYHMANVIWILYVGSRKQLEMLTTNVGCVNVLAKRHTSLPSNDMKFRQCLTRCRVMTSDDLSKFHFISKWSCLCSIWQKISIFSSSVDISSAFEKVLFYSDTILISRRI